MPAPKKLQTTTPEAARVLGRVVQDWMLRNPQYEHRLHDLPAEVEEELHRAEVDALIAAGVPLPFWAVPAMNIPPEDIPPEEQTMTKTYDDLRGFGLIPAEQYVLNDRSPHGVFGMIHQAGCPHFVPHSTPRPIASQLVAELWAARVEHPERIALVTFCGDCAARRIQPGQQPGHQPRSRA